MNTKDVFSVGLRIVGLLSIGRCISDLAFVGTYLIGSDNISVTAKFPGTDFIIGVSYLLAGLYLVRGAPMIVNFAFPNKLSPKEDSN